MYPPPKPPEPSKLDAKDAVALIETIVNLSIVRTSIAPENLSGFDEHMELVLRQLIDCLLAIDARSGLYLKGPND